ncbi:hypothetical protein FDK38_001578 [Candidozyma auris]|nr:hypothetical protein FDK38_001578 [[Candida] auris]
MTQDVRSEVTEASAGLNHLNTASFIFNLEKVYGLNSLHLNDLVKSLSLLCSPHSDIPHDKVQQIFNKASLGLSTAKSLDVAKAAIDVFFRQIEKCNTIHNEDLSKALETFKQELNSFGEKKSEMMVMHNEMTKKRLHAAFMSLGARERESRKFLDALAYQCIAFPRNKRLTEAKEALEKRLRQPDVNKLGCVRDFLTFFNEMAEMEYHRINRLFCAVICSLIE